MQTICKNRLNLTQALKYQALAHFRYAGQDISLCYIFII